MVKLIQISKEELHGLVHIAYEGDYDLLDKYHIKKFNLESAVSSTLEMIDGMSKQLELKYFSVEWQGTQIGYVIISGDFLYSFGISIYHRTKNILKSWWDCLLLVMGDRIKVGLLSNNTRAIEYMKKRGLEITWSNPENKKINEVLLTLN